MICKEGDVKEVKYTSEHLEILKKLRSEALNISYPLIKKGLKPYIYGSVARGDVDNESDVDIVILHYVSPFIIESSIESMKFKIYKKIIIQATPRSTPKIYYWLDEYGKRIISYPLKKLSKNELSFYKFGGMLSSEDVRRGKRVAGVDKRLMLIQPTKEGHIETCIIGRTGWVARVLSIPESIINERIYMLSKREIYGRTGVFLEYVLSPGEDISSAIKLLKSTNRYFRESLLTS